METTFENARVGDRVWSVEYGWGKVTDIDHQVRVEFFDGEWENYMTTGQTDEGCMQTLFWDEIEITPPPRPKRKVVKTVEAWLNIYDHYVRTKTHSTKQEADECAREGRIACVKLTGEYEVEE